MAAVSTTCGHTSVMDTTTRWTIDRFSGDRNESASDILVTEEQVTITANGDKLISTACSPGILRELTYGYLISEGMIRSIDDVTSYREEEGAIDVRISPTRNSQSLVPLASSYSILLKRMLEGAEQAQQSGTLFRQTGGTHAAAIFAPAGDMIFVEDISRTCAMEKAIGEALLAEADFSNSFIFLSSRISLSMVRKIARCKIPIIGCVSAPTFQAVAMADKLGICLCGFVRGERMNIYTHAERIIA